MQESSTVKLSSSKFASYTLYGTVTFNGRRIQKGFIVGLVTEEGLNGVHIAVAYIVLIAN